MRGPAARARSFDDLGNREVFDATRVRGQVPGIARAVGLAGGGTRRGSPSGKGSWRDADVAAWGPAVTVRPLRLLGDPVPRAPVTESRGP